MGRLSRFDRVPSVPQDPTATMNAAYAICMFANRSCECALRRGRPCDTVNQAARAVINAAKAELGAKRAARSD